MVRLPSVSIAVSPIELLIEDTERKRIIDVVTSVVSRSLLPRDNPRHSPVGVQLGQVFQRSMRRLRAEAGGAGS